MPLVDKLAAEVRSIHLIGIAGTAMGSLAGMLKDAGYAVTGSDRAVYPPMSDYLEGLGIDVMKGFVAENLRHEPDLVVVGNVVRKDYEEAAALLSSDLSYCSMPQLMGMRFIGDAHSVVISGTHGKTTTTAIVAWLLESAGLAPGFMIGGVPGNFDRTARAGAGSHFVVEGDEYDTAFFDKGPKFLHYRPTTAILTSVEFDHADIYTDLDHVKASFRKLVGIMPADGTLVARWDDPNVVDVVGDAGCRVVRYGPGQDWDGRVESVDTATGRMTFTVLRGGVPVGTYTSIMVGEHNLYNQVAATAAALAAGVPESSLAAGFASFRGIKRRQEVIGEPGGITVIDDFAHHPTAVRVTLDALRTRFGGRRLWALWEPRSATSRRNVFQQAYAEAFDSADQVVVAAPYDTSRIASSERFSSEELVRALGARGIDAILLDGPDAIARTVALRALPGDVVAVLSNGAFGGLHGRLLDLFERRFDADRS